jgi:hypothetical protein
MGYRARPKPVVVKGGKVSEVEAEKRARLKREIAELSKPAFGVELARAEKKAIAIEVRSGLMSQGGWPRSMPGWYRGKN